MEWAADGQSHVDDVVEFESRVNDVWRGHDDAVICVYDLAKFGGDTVIDWPTRSAVRPRRPPATASTTA